MEISNPRKRSSEIIQSDWPVKPVTHPRFKETPDEIERRPTARFLRAQLPLDTPLASPLLVRSGFSSPVTLRQKLPSKDFVNKSLQPSYSEENLKIGWGSSDSESLTAQSSRVHFSTPDLIIKKKKPETWNVKQNSGIKGTKSYLCVPHNSTTLNTKRVLKKVHSCPTLEISPIQRLVSTTKLKQSDMQSFDSAGKKQSVSRLSASTYRRKTTCTTELKVLDFELEQTSLSTRTQNGRNYSDSDSNRKEWNINPLEQHLPETSLNSALQEKVNRFLKSLEKFKIDDKLDDES